MCPSIVMRFGQRQYGPRQVFEDSLHLGKHGGAAHAKEGRAVPLHQLDAQAFGGQLDLDLVPKGVGQAEVLHLLPEVLGRGLERTLFRDARAVARKSPAGREAGR